MKKRLCGLFAIVLCLMVTFAPAASLAAPATREIIVYEVVGINYASGADAASMESGHLIANNKTIHFEYKGASEYHKIDFADTFTGDVQFVSVPESRSGKPPVSVTLSSLMGIAQNGYTQIQEVYLDELPHSAYAQVSTVNMCNWGAPLFETSAENSSTKIFGFEMLEPYDSDSGMSFGDFAIVNDITADSVYCYEIVAAVPTNTEGVYELTSDGPFTFTIPIKDVETVRVLHRYDWYSDTFEEEDVEVTDDGIKLTVESLSPFVLYVNHKDNSGVGEPGIPEGGGGNAAVPTTGDNSQLMLWLALAAASLAGMIFIRRKRSA